jgi:hypothetical protein
LNSDNLNIKNKTMKKNIYKVDGLIYVTCEEEIKPSDYYLWKNKEVIHANEIEVSFHPTVIIHCKKIIATNNNTLPIQQLTKEEVAYCEVNDFVEYGIREFEEVGLTYKLLIPKEQNIIDDYLQRNPNAEIDKQVELEAEAVAKEHEVFERNNHSISLCDVEEQETIEEYLDINTETFDLTKSSDLPYYHNDRNKILDAINFGIKSQQPIINQLKEDKEELLEMLKELHGQTLYALNENDHRSSYTHKPSKLYDKIEQLIQKHSKR